MNRLVSALVGKRVVICAGAGGVGKTTVSATVALGLAAQGRRVALVTIDPARRLAEALGLDALGNRPQVVDEARFGGSGLEIHGALAAMMLDAKRTFDELIGLLAPTPATRDEILRNPIYGHISTAVAGSQEYTAIAKLYELERLVDQLQAVACIALPFLFEAELGPGQLERLADLLVGRKHERLG